MTRRILRPAWLGLCASVLGFLAPLMSAEEVLNDGGAGAVGPPTDQLIVRRHSGDRVLNAAQLRALSQVAGLELKLHRVAANDALVLKLPHALPLGEAWAAAAHLLRADPTLEYAEPDAILLPALVPNDPYYNDPSDPYSVQWHYFEAVGGVNLPAAWNLTQGDPSLRVAVLDTGILPHEDLVGRYTPYEPGVTQPGAAGYDFVSNSLRANDGDGRDPDPTDPGDWVTEVESQTPNTTFSGCPVGNSSWHGTHVAGTVGASTGNALGVAGINWASKILPVRVLGKCGGYNSDVADAIIWAAGGSVYGVPANPSPARVLNLSLTGSGTCSSTFQNAINQALSLGATVVVAAGNNGLDAAAYQPASCNNVVTVGATDRCGHRPWYSNYGPSIEISAPGGGYAANGSMAGVLSTGNDGTTGPGADFYALSLGTSMATPHVAGIVSLMLSINPALTPSQVVDIVRSTARAFPASNPCAATGQSYTCSAVTCGAGIIDAHAALEQSVPNDPPSVTIVVPTNGATYGVGAIIDFAGTASDTEDGDLTALLTWTSSRDGQIGTGGSFSRTLSAGSHTITASVTDSHGQSSSAGLGLSLVAPNSPPALSITNPAERSAFPQGQAIAFSGSAIDAEDGNLSASLVWTSDRDGQIGNGGAFSRTLTPGAHTITAAVTDSGGLAASAQRHVSVIATTSLSLTSVGADDGWVLESTETSGVGGTLKAADSTSKGLLLGDTSKDYQYRSILSFDTAAIPDNATLVSATLRITRGAASGGNPFLSLGSLLVDVQSGILGNGRQLETADFQASATAVAAASLSNAPANLAVSEGSLNASGLAAINKTGVTQLRLYFQTDDNDNAVADYLGYYSGEATSATYRPQLLVSYFVNAAPSLAIVTPADGAQVAPGTLINFSATATDPEEGDLGTYVVWTSDRDGPIGTGGSFSSAALSEGIHRIQARVTDSAGASASATISLINSFNHPPAVSINAPGNGATALVGTEVGFSGSASDPEQGDLSATLVWTSSLNGIIGSGASFSTASLSLGTHSIQAKATDPQGFYGSATLTLTVFAPTTVTLTSVGADDGWVLESTETSGVGGTLKASDTSSKALLVGDTRNDYQYRSILSFDTSGIPDNATVVSATLRLMRGTLVGTNPSDTHGALLVDVQSRGFSGNRVLEKTDFQFQTPATALGAASLSKAAANLNWSEGSLNAAGLAAIDKTGVTQFRVYFQLDDNDDAGDDYLGYYSGEASTAAYRPQLVVTYH